MTTAINIVPGSLRDVSRRSGSSLAESFLSADAIILVDYSPSMDARDARGGRRRFDVACDEMAKLQAAMPGKIAVVGFSGSAQFCPGGQPPDPSTGSGTNLAGALRFVLPADGTMRFIVISDGQPDSETEALKVAGTMQSKLDTIFCGAESDLAAQEFLRLLSAATGGTYVVAAKAHELAKSISVLMLGTTR